MSEIPRWRRITLSVGIVIALLSPVYFVIGLNFGSSLIRSDKRYGNFIVSGIVLGVSSLVCGIAGEGAHRWTLILGAAVEIVLWWFMAVGG